MEMETAYQEHNGDVQQECYHGVGKQDAKANIVDVAHVHFGHFNDEGSDAVHDGANGCKVVQRHERIHLEFSGTEQALDQSQANGLKDDTAGLIEEAGQNKRDLTVGRNHDANYDEGDVTERLQTWRRNAETPCRQKNRDWCCCLENVNEVLARGAGNSTLSI